MWSTLRGLGLSALALWGLLSPGLNLAYAESELSISELSPHHRKPPSDTPNLSDYPCMSSAEAAPFLPGLRLTRAMRPGQPHHPDSLQHSRVLLRHNGCHLMGELVHEGPRAPGLKAGEPQKEPIWVRWAPSAPPLVRGQLLTLEAKASGYELVLFVPDAKPELPSKAAKGPFVYGIWRTRSETSLPTDWGPLRGALLSKLGKDSKPTEVAPAECEVHAGKNKGGELYFHALHCGGFRPQGTLLMLSPNLQSIQAAVSGHALDPLQPKAPTLERHTLEHLEVKPVGNHVGLYVHMRKQRYQGSKLHPLNPQGELETLVFHVFRNGRVDYGALPTYDDSPEAIPKPPGRP